MTIPSFLVKTYDFVNDHSFDDIICWNDEGDGFIVKQVNKFSEEILPKYFKHNNFSSFIRQLNMYDFHKTRNSSNQQCFQHSCFKKGQKQLLQEIKRKNSAGTATVEKQQVALKMQAPMQFNQIMPSEYPIKTEHHQMANQGFGHGYFESDQQAIGMGPKQITAGGQGIAMTRQQPVSIEYGGPFYQPADFSGMINQKQIKYDPRIEDQPPQNLS